MMEEHHFAICPRKMMEEHFAILPGKMTQDTSFCNCGK